MTQPSRTTESISRDNAAIREIMHQARELTVPDRATLAVGLVGHLATMMNRSQMAKLLDELQAEAERVQDVPPVRQQEFDARTAGTRQGEEPRGTPDARDADAAGRPRVAAREPGPASDRDSASDRGSAPDREADGGRGSASDVGQGGRGEFRARELL